MIICSIVSIHQYNSSILLLKLEEKLGEKMKIVKLILFGLGGIVRQYHTRETKIIPDAINIEKKEDKNPTTFIITKDEDTVIEETAYEYSITMKKDK